MTTIASMPAHERQRISAKGILRILAGIGLLFFLSAVGSYWFWSSRHARRVQKLIAEIEARGEPVRASELDEYFLPPSEFEDTTPLWKEGVESLFNRAFQPEWEALLPYFRERKLRLFSGDVSQAAKENWPVMALAEKYLREHQSDHEKLHLAAERGGFARFDGDWGDLGRLLTHYDGLRRAQSCLLLELDLKVLRGDVRGAARCLRTMLVMRNALSQQPSATEQAGAATFDRDAASALADYLLRLDFTQEELVDFQSRLRAKKPLEGLRIGLLSERALLFSALENYRAMGEEQPFLPATYYDMAFCLDSMKLYLAAAEEPFPNCLARAKTLDASITTRAPHSKSQWTLAYSSLIFSRGMSRCFEATARDLAYIAAADAGIAMEQFRR